MFHSVVYVDGDDDLSFENEEELCAYSGNLEDDLAFGDEPGERLLLKIAILEHLVAGIIPVVFLALNEHFDVFGHCPQHSDHGFVSLMRRNQQDVLPHLSKDIVPR